ncbi:Hypothetical predicted protein [Olea europaea subsp. europaea]|uniref:Uncharacterized protein n=1 Tax=Olea europaea subsp. europaea TaxID=158383 RepID=A0A8S0PVK1_OLEEU|nr:Hypothetical predicted protein [Olea europaea subsp. europaea]
MAKKVPSIALHKKKPIKNNNKRKKVRPIFKKIWDYFKSDSYMFAPLLSPTPSFNVEGYDYEPIKENKKKSKTKFLWEFVDYMKSDCYLYAPLVRRQPWLYSSNDTATPPPKESVCHIRADTGKHGDQTKNGTEEPTGPGGNAVNVLQENLHDDGISSSKSTIIKHVLVQGEKVKHRVQRKYCFVPGEMHAEKESSRIVVE